MNDQQTDNRYTFLSCFLAKAAGSRLLSASDSRLLSATANRPLLAMAGSSTDPPRLAMAGSSTEPAAATPPQPEHPELGCWDRLLGRGRIPRTPETGGRIPRTPVEAPAPARDGVAHALPYIGVYFRGLVQPQPNDPAGADHRPAYPPRRYTEYQSKRLAGTQRAENKRLHQRYHLKPDEPPRARTPPRKFSRNRR